MEGAGRVWLEGGKERRDRLRWHHWLTGECGWCMWEQEARVVGSFLIAILCGTMVLEWAVHYMEHHVEEAVRRLLDKVYKELALLGIIR